MVDEHNEEDVISFRREVATVQADLFDALGNHWARAGNHVVAWALVETAGSALRAIVLAEPAALADIDRQIRELQLFLSALAHRRPSIRWNRAGEEPGVNSQDGPIPRSLGRRESCSRCGYIQPSLSRLESCYRCGGEIDRSTSTMFGKNR